MIPAHVSSIRFPPASPSLLALPHDTTFAQRLADAAEGRLVPVVSNTFPDAETYLRLVEETVDAEVAIVGSLRDPDRRALPLMLLADAAASGARRASGSSRRISRTCDRTPSCTRAMR